MIRFLGKRLRLRTKVDQIICERFTVIVHGKVYWIHAKRLDTWVPVFCNDNNNSLSSDEELFDANIGTWLPTSSKLLVIYLYAPQELTEKEQEKFGSLFNIQGANVFNNFILMSGLIDLRLGGIFPLGCNASFIALILKIQDAKVVRDFCPDHDGIDENTNHEKFDFDDLQIGCNLLHDVADCEEFTDVVMRIGPQITIGFIFPNHFQVSTIDNKVIINIELNNGRIRSRCYSLSTIPHRLIIRIENYLFGFNILFRFIYNDEVINGGMLG
nr:hypothetical protein [Tanacetum cinerariifolium]